jgi:3-phosphoglycerate kinase
MKKCISDLGSLAGKKVLIRVDFNVPLTGSEVQDDYRIRSSIPTIKKVIEQGGRAILISHLGRPEGESKPELSLAPIAKRLEEIIEKPVKFVADTVGNAAQEAVSALGDGELLVLENLRFHPGEKTNAPSFADALAALGDVVISDAFGTCHRDHASVCGLPARLPAAAGELVLKEIEELSPLLENAPRPFVMVLGGAKLSTKIPLMKNMLGKVDAILVGGGMAYTLLKAQGRDVGKSRIDESMLEIAQDILEELRNKSREGGATMILPVDNVAAMGIDDHNGYTIVQGNIPADRMGLDVGPETLALFVAQLRKAKTVFWNGPLGVFETAPFHMGTEYIATYLAHRSEVTRTIVGGGDSAAAVRQLKLADRMGHISTGGGASMEFLEGKSLPGIDALPDKES